MKAEAKDQALTALYIAARTALMDAAKAADEAVQAMQGGDANQAAGIALAAKGDTDLAATMLAAAAALHRAG